MEHDSALAAPETTGARRPNRVDAIATVLLLCVHTGLAFFVAFMSLFFVMITDGCAYEACGDERWVTRAIYVAVGGGGVTLLADVVVAAILLSKNRIAFYVPVAGCAAQLGVTMLVIYVSSLAGPIK